MKTMTCNQLGGPENCIHPFQAETFEEIAEMSKNHGMEMFSSGDEDHLAAMKKMQELMSSADSEAMMKWMQARKAEFDSLAEDE